MQMSSMLLNPKLTGDIYSTSEVKTNKKWTNGKPIYRKVFEFATSSSNVNSWTTLASVSDLNIDTVMTLEGTYREGTSNYFHPINYYESSTAYFVVMVLGNNLAYKKASGGTMIFYSKIILEYTKTTD